MKRQKDGQPKYIDTRNHCIIRFLKGMKFLVFQACCLLVFPLDMCGQITFLKTYGDFDHEAGYTVKECFDGGYIIAGYRGTPIMLTRTNQLGDTLWVREYPLGFSTGFDVIQTPDGHFVVSGHIGGTEPNTLLMKVNDSGEIIWINTLCRRWAQAVQTTFDGHLICAGNGLMKTTAQGDTVWCKPTSEMQVMYIIESTDSQYVLCGYQWPNIYLQKRDTAGTILWTQSFPGTHQNTSNNILTQSRDGGYIFTGNDGLGNSMLMHTDPDGHLLWSDSIPDFISTSVIQTSDGGFALGGRSYEDCKLGMVKTDSLGKKEWSQTYCSPDLPSFPSFASEIKSIRQTVDRGYILTGHCESSMHHSLDMVLIKTDSLGAIHTTGTEDPPLQKHLQVYPNPFRSYTCLSLNFEPQDATLLFYNVMGEVVMSKSHLSSQIIEFERGTLPAGMYMTCLLQQGIIMATHKVVISN